jgi:predicted nuclease of predicted toxin-antitoxin system
VNFLVDANLPPRLWLKLHGQEAEHLFHLNLLAATDTQICRLGRAAGLVIISKDVDFYDRALLFGAPPQVVPSQLATAAMPGFWMR